MDPYDVVSTAWPAEVSAAAYRPVACFLLPSGDLASGRPGAAPSTSSRGRGRNFTMELLHADKGRPLRTFGKAAMMALRLTCNRTRYASLESQRVYVRAPDDELVVALLLVATPSPDTPRRARTSKFMSFYTGSRGLIVPYSLGENARLRISVAIVVLAPALLGPGPFGPYALRCTGADSAVHYTLHLSSYAVDYALLADAMQSPSVPAACSMHRDPTTGKFRKKGRVQVRVPTKIKGPELGPGPAKVRRTGDFWEPECVYGREEEGSWEKTGCHAHQFVWAAEFDEFFSTDGRNEQ